MSQTDKRTFYISFATEDQFLGAVIMAAADFVSALAPCHALGINPGGEAAAIELGEVPERWLKEWGGRLLSREDADRSAVELEKILKLGRADIATLSEQQAKDRQDIWQATVLKAMEKYKDQRLTPELAAKIRETVERTLASLELIEDQLLQKDG